MMNARDLLPEPPQSDELFVTFANTLEYTNGIPTDHVAEPAALLAWLRENGLISERGRKSGGNSGKKLIFDQTDGGTASTT